MPRIPPKKCITCSQLDAAEAKELHGENGDCCWNPEKCYFRRSYYKNRLSYVEKRWRARHPGETRQNSQDQEGILEVPLLEYPVAILQMYRSNASSDVHAVGAELWIGGKLDSVRTGFNRLSTNTVTGMLIAIKQHPLANHELSPLPIEAFNQPQPDNRLGLPDVSVSGV